MVFEAFRVLYHELYRTYASALLGDVRADAAVHETWKYLSGCWEEALRSPRPAAFAWAVLQGFVACEAGPSWPQGRVAEVMVVCCTMRLTASAAADLMGLEVMGAARGADGVRLTAACGGHEAGVPRA